MKMVQVDLSSFPPKKQEELREKLLALAWDDYIITPFSEKCSHCIFTSLSVYVYTSCFVRLR